ncbi:hypothetical protein AUK22_04880 [bacterium CG2_30_54_10]|nr:MAG: hypothetical protein AUK22_04880 [bacterium CG2_30_54_10]
MNGFILKESWPDDRVKRIPARTLAYVGDSVFELAMRIELISEGLDESGRLHSSVVSLVNTDNQARLFDELLPTVPDTEQILLKTWRNAKMPYRTGGSSRGAYARATAFEAWLGYLFLTGQQERIEEILRYAKS